MKLILVAGPRSSGTRMLTSWLIQCGAYGDDTHLQRLDAVDPWDFGYKPEVDKINLTQVLSEVNASNGWMVLRRSIPHGWGLPQFGKTIDGFRTYDIHYHCAFFITRDFWASCQSMIAAGHEANFEDASRSLLGAIRLFYREPLANVIPVTYELMNNRLYRLKLLEMAGIDLPDRGLSFNEENFKYYLAAGIPKVAD